MSIHDLTQAVADAEATHNAVADAAAEERTFGGVMASRIRLEASIRAARIERGMRCDMRLRFGEAASIRKAYGACCARASIERRCEDCRKCLCDQHTDAWSSRRLCEECAAKAYEADKAEALGFAR